SPDLPAPAHLRSFDPPPLHRNRLSGRAALSGLLAGGGRARRRGLRQPAELQWLVHRPAAAVRLVDRLLLPSAERYPASGLGCRLGLRAADRLSHRLGGCHRYRRPDPHRLDHRLLSDGGVLMDEVTKTPNFAGAASYRSDIARVRGLGSAKEGVQHWWMQRFSALALIPLGLWLVISLVAHAGADRAGIMQWLGSPFTLGALSLTILAAFY